MPMTFYEGTSKRREKKFRRRSQVKASRDGKGCEREEERKVTVTRDPVVFESAS